MEEPKDGPFGGSARIFDDLARMAGGAVNMMSTFQQQVRDDIKSRVDEMATRMDLVPRQDLDKATAQIEALYKRVALLEKQVAEMTGKPAAAKKAAKASAPESKMKTTAKNPAKSRTNTAGKTATKGLKKA